MSTSILDCCGKTLTEDEVKQIVKELRKLVLGDAKLKNFRTEDEYLLRFLHCTQFNVPEAFKKMQTFTDLIIELPNWFATMPPLDKREQIEKNDKGLLNARDRKGRAIVVIKTGKMDTINSCPPEQSQIFDMWLECIMDDPKTQAAGVSCILDMDGFSWRLFKWVTPSNIKTVVRRVQVYPFKELLVHVVNTSFLLSAAIKLVWPFLDERLKNMIKFHYNDYSSLHEFINPNVLPFEYNGTGPDINYEKSNQVLFDNSSEIGVKLKYQDVTGMNHH